MKTEHTVWIWAEHRNGRLMDVSLEVLGKARELADEIEGTTAAIIIGGDVQQEADELLAHGAGTVYLFSDPELELYQNEAYTRLISDLVLEKQPDIFLMGATTLAMDLAPTVAARVKTGLTAHSFKLEIDHSGETPLLIAAVPGWGGGMVVNILCPEHRPQMATVSPGVGDIPDRIANPVGTVVERDVVLNENDFRLKTVEMVDEPPDGLQVDQAETVVAGGYGMKAAGGMQPLKELADLLGAAVGGTRPTLEEGWIRESNMIGVSGKIISPKLLFTIATSGASHYSAGFNKAGTVVAVNNDPGASVFEQCDIGLVGDVTQILPVMIEMFSRS